MDHRTSTTNAVLTPGMSTGEIQFIAKEIEQRHARGHCRISGLAIDGNGDIFADRFAHCLATNLRTGFVEDPPDNLTCDPFAVIRRRMDIGIRVQRVDN